MKKRYMTLEIDSWSDAWAIKRAILVQIKFYGGCGNAVKNAFWLDEKKRKEEFLDCVNKVKMLVGYYRKISKGMK